MTIRLAVLGCGNMARALVIPMAKWDKELEVHTYTPSKTKARALAQEIGGVFQEELYDFPQCDYWMIACKPQQFSDLARELKGLLPKNTTILSVLAGTSSSKIQKELGQEKVVRIMPNTPAMVGAGVSALYFSPSINESEKIYINDLFKQTGTVFTFDKEDEIDRITGFSGSGPAYFFEIARIMSAKMESMGIDSSVAREMVLHTILGSGQMMLESTESFETLRNNVTSKGGVTFEALEVFKAANLEGIFSDALDAAYKRAKELKQ